MKKRNDNCQQRSPEPLKITTTKQTEKSDLQRSQRSCASRFLQLYSDDPAIRNANWGNSRESIHRITFSFRTFEWFPRIASNLRFVIACATKRDLQNSGFSSLNRFAQIGPSKQLTQKWLSKWWFLIFHGLHETHVMNRQLILQIFIIMYVFEGVASKSRWLCQDSNKIHLLYKRWLSIFQGV